MIDIILEVQLQYCFFLLVLLLISNYANKQNVTCLQFSLGSWYLTRYTPWSQQLEVYNK